jgi:hypothetical protein
MKKINLKVKNNFLFLAHDKSAFAITILKSLDLI